MRIKRKWALIVLGLAVAAMVLARTFSGPARSAAPPDGATGMAAGQDSGRGTGHPAVGP